MLNNITYGKYFEVKSINHELNPLLKVISLIIMIISCFFINSYKDCIIIVSYLLLGVAYSNINVKIYLKELISIKIIYFIILLVDIITFNNIETILSDLIRIIYLIIYFSIFMKCTSVNEIIYAIDNILKPFSLVSKKSDISIYIALIFKFPNIFIKKLIKYNKLKKSTIKNKSIKEILSIYINDIVCIFNLSINELNKMNTYLRTKLYNYGKSRTNYKLKKLEIKEMIFMLLNISILLIVIFY